MYLVASATFFPSILLWNRRAPWSDARRLPAFVLELVLADSSEDASRSRWIRCSIVISISACHAEDPGSITGGGVSFECLASCSLDMDLLDRSAPDSAIVAGISQSQGPPLDIHITRRSRWSLFVCSVFERFRRWIRNPLGSARRGSKLFAVVCRLASLDPSFVSMLLLLGIGRNGYAKSPAAQRWLARVEALIHQWQCRILVLDH